MKRKPLIICLVVMIVCSVWLSGRSLYGFINTVKFLPQEINNKDYVYTCILSGIGVGVSFIFLLFSSLFTYLLVKREHILLSQEEVKARKQRKLQKKAQKKQVKIKRLQNHINTLKKDG